MSVIAVTGLFAYPIKSCAGIALLEAHITPRGLGADPRDCYMIVDDPAGFCPSVEIPEMALIVPTDVDTNAIRLVAPRDAVRRGAAWRRARGCAPGRRDRAWPARGLVEVSDEALNDWYTRFLPALRENRRYRLLRVVDEAPRLISPSYRRPEASNQVGFADGHSILLAAEPSLAQLDTEIGEPVPLNRFRPNVVVDGADLEPYDGDSGSSCRSARWARSWRRPRSVRHPRRRPQATAVTGKAVRRALTTRRGRRRSRRVRRRGVLRREPRPCLRPGLAISVGDPVRVVSRTPSRTLSSRRASADGALTILTATRTTGTDVEGALGRNGCIWSPPALATQLASGTSFQTPATSPSGSETTSRASSENSGVPFGRDVAFRERADVGRVEERARFALARVAERPELSPSLVAIVPWNG